MLDRFTDGARRVMTWAVDEARMLNQAHVGTEHILAGLIREGEGPAARALLSLGVTLEAVRQQIEQITGTVRPSPAGKLSFTPQAKQVLELSLWEALRLGHYRIGTEHIMLAVIHDGQSVGAQVLAALDVGLTALGERMVELAPSSAPEEPAHGTGVHITGSRRSRGPTRQHIRQLESQSLSELRRRPPGSMAS
jgi:ATP-dependent Clp protease ATP-binding subunit ClpC